MASFRIKWTVKAHISLNIILEFYLKQNGNATYSLALASEIEEGIKILYKHPLSGKSIGLEDIHELVFERNSVFYRVVNQEIHILLVWDNRRNPSALKILLSESGNL